MTVAFEFVDAAVPSDLRERVLTAALDELSRWGIERFDVRTMASHHRIDERDVQRYWGSGQRLLLDLMTYRSDHAHGVPDTGSLRGDLEALALGLATHLNTDLGRRLLRATTRDTRVQVPDDTRMVYWRSRYETVRGVLTRAEARGEVRDGVDHLAAMQILLSPLNIRGLYTDDAIGDDYCHTVADLAWRAIRR